MKIKIKNLVGKMVIDNASKNIYPNVEECLNRVIANTFLHLESETETRKSIAKKFLKSDLKEMYVRTNPILSPDPITGYMTARSSLEVLLDMVVYQSQLSKYKAPLSKEEFLKICIDRLSFSYDALIHSYQYILKNQSK
jgi:hypothetical protein